ncbi:MAG TPA: hypothetical protein VFU82_06185 [Gammaproteobacteria bacterium]|nr:hypothetical protein [Gammaproteobacteria bacterium]
MYNDLQVPAQEINPAAINHTDYAFLAAKNGESEFLEVLLGPSALYIAQLNDDVAIAKYSMASM